MPSVVKLNDGQEIEFPDGVSEDQITSALQRDFPDNFSRIDSGQSRPKSVMNAFMKGGSTAMGQTLQGAERMLRFSTALGMPEGFGDGGIDPITQELMRRDKLTTKENQAEIAAGPLYRKGAEIVEGAEEAFPTNPKFRGEFWSDTIPSSAGAMIPTVASAIAAGPVAAAVQYGSSAGQSEAQAAINAGREDQADKAFLLNLGIGAASEALLGVPANIMRYVRAARKAGVDKAIVKQAIVKEIGKGALREAGQETIEQAGSNLAAQNTYDPNRPITEGLPQAAAAGLLLGGGVSAVATGVGRASQASERGRRSLEAMRPPQAIQEAPDDAGFKGIETRINANLDAMRPEFDAATDRVTAAITERKNIKGEDARLAGARDRLPEMGYAYNEAQDVFIPVRRIERATNENPPSNVAPQAPPAVQAPLVANQNQARQPLIEAAPAMEFARQIVELSPQDFVQNAQSFNKVNIELGRSATPEQVVELTKLRDRAQQRLQEIRQTAEASGNPADIENYVRLSTMPQFFNEAIAEASAKSTKESSSLPVEPSAKVTPTAVEQSSPAAVSKTSVVSTGKPNGAKAEVEYDVVEAASLKPLLVGTVSADQTRQRVGNTASDEQIAKIATAPDIALLSESPTSTVGAPIIDDVVIAGNGRVSGLIAGYEGTTRGAQDYRRGVVAEAKRLGIGDVSNMVNPVLIRRVKRYTSGDKASFVVESNPKYAALKESTSEAALLDAQALGDIGALPFNESGSLTAAGVQQVARLFDASQRNLTRTVGGDFDAREANNRVQLAALALLARENNVPVTDFIGLIESDDGRRVMGEVTRVAPRLTKLDADLRIGGRILTSMRELQRGIAAVRDGAYTSLDEWNAERQRELLQSGLDPASEALLGVMIKSQSKGAILRDVFNEYLTLAEYEQNQRNEAGQTADIFGEKRQPATAETIVGKVLQPGQDGRQVVAPSNQQREPEVNEPEAKPAAPVATPTTPAPVVETESAGSDSTAVPPLVVQAQPIADAPVPLSIGSKARVKTINDETGKVSFPPQLWTILEETTDPKFPDERTFKVQNDRTKKVEERDLASLQPVKARSAEDRESAKDKTIDELKDELRRLNPRWTRDAIKDLKTKREVREQIKRERATAPKPTLKQRAAELAAKLDVLKAADPRRGNLSLFGLTQYIWNGAVSAAQGIIRAGGTVADAIQAALRHIRDNHTGDWDEAGAIAALEAQLNDNEPEKQTEFGAKIGENKDVENIREIQASLVDAGYGVADTVTPENTAQAWRLFIGFVDPNTRRDWLDQLRSAVPQEMAPGILQSELWKYAVRLASQGRPALFRAMAQNSNHFLMGTGDAFRSTFGRGLRALRLGADFTTWKNELERSKEQRKAISRELGVAPDLIDLLVENLNGARPEVAPIVTAVSEAPLPGGQTIQQTLDLGLQEQGEDADPSEGQMQADAILNRMAREQSDTPSDYRPYSRDEVREAFRGLLSGDITESEFRATLDSIGVRPETAATLISVGNREIENRNAIARNRRLEAIAKALEEERKKSTKTAAEILRRLELDYAGVDWVKPENKNLVRLILNEHYKGESPILPIQGNTNRIIQDLAARFVNEAGVSTEIANQLATAAEVKRQSDWTNARSKAIGRATTSKNLRSLVEDILASPYLAQSDPAWVKTTAERWFMSNGLSKEQATGAAAIFDREFRLKLLDAQTKIAEKLLEKAKPEKLKGFLEAIRAGLLDPDKPWAETFAEKAGLRSPTKEQFQRLASLELALHDGNLTAPERAQIVEEMMGIYLHLKLPPPLISRIASNLVVTSLTGLRTGTVNIFAPIVRLLTETGLKTAARPQDALRNLKTLMEAYRGFLRRLQFSLTKDAYTFINNEYEQSTNEMRRIWETAMDDMQSGSNWRRGRGALKTLWGSQQFYMRLLNSLDQANAVSEREVQMVNYSSSAFRNAGLGTSRVNALVEAVSRLKQAAYEDAINRLKLKPDQATVHADETAFEELERFVAAEIGGEIGVSESAKARDSAERDAYSAIGRLAPEVSESDEGGVGSRLFYHPLLAISNLLRRGKGAEPILGVSLLGYVSIPIRTARYIAWNTHYGLFRLGIHHYRKKKGLDNWWKQSLATEAQEKHRLKMALAGSAATTLLAALGFALLKSSSDDDAGDDEIGLYVTGKGPKNKQLRDSWERSGFRDNSLVFFFRKKPITIPLTRLGEPLAHLFWPLAAKDDHDWRKKEAAATGKEFAESWTETTGYAMGTYIGLLGQRGVFQNVSYWAKLGSGEGGTKKILADLASKTAANAVIPWMGMQRSFTGIAEGKLDKSSIQSVIGANLGLIGIGLQQPAINRFGDKLGNRTWYGIIADTGVPVAFQVENTPENEKFYTTLARKGISAPELQRRNLEKKYGELTDDQFHDFGQKSGNLLKQSVQKNLAAIQAMTPENADKFITNAAQQADAIAAAALALKPVPKKAAAAPASVPAPAPVRPVGQPQAASPASSPSPALASRGLSSRPRSGRIRSSLARMKVPKLRKSSGRIRSRLSRGFKKPRVAKLGRIRSRVARVRRPRIRSYVA